MKALVNVKVSRKLCKCVKRMIICICDIYQNLINWLMIVEDDLNSNNCDLYLYQSSIMMRTLGVQ